MNRNQITDDHMRNLFYFGAPVAGEFFYELRRKDWDAWIAEHDRQVAYQAWNEGFDEAMDDIGASESMAEHGETSNPYRG